MQIAAGNSILHCRRSGAPIRPGRPTVVFLHGWGRAMDDFDELARRVASALPERSFLQLDLPGFGGSPLAAPGGFSLADYCAVLEEVFAKLGISTVILIGHSFGGRIAIAFGARHPERVRKLILISAAGIRRTSLARLLIGVGRAFFRTIFVTVRNVRFILGLERILGSLFGSQDYRQAAGPLRETLKKILAEDVRSAAAHLPMPVLMLWGRRDEITPLRDGRTLAAAIPKARVEILDGGHFVFLERPEECARLMASFLEHA